MHENATGYNKYNNIQQMRCTHHANIQKAIQIENLNSSFMIIVLATGICFFCTCVCRKSFWNRQFWNANVNTMTNFQNWIVHLVVTYLLMNCMFCNGFWKQMLKIIFPKKKNVIKWFENFFVACQWWTMFNWFFVSCAQCRYNSLFWIQMSMWTDL